MAYTCNDLGNLHITTHKVGPHTKAVACVTSKHTHTHTTLLVNATYAVC